MSKRFIIMSVFSFILFLFSNCNVDSSVRSSDLATDDILSEDDILSDVSADIDADKGIKYIYEDKPFIQYESQLFDKNNSVNTLLEYNNKIIFGGEDGIYIFEESNFVKVELYGNENIVKLLKFGEYLVVIKERYVQVGDLYKIIDSKEFTNPIIYWASDDQRLIFGDNGDSLYIYDGIKFINQNVNYGIRHICSTKDGYYIVSNNAVLKVGREFEDPSLVVQGFFNSIDCAFENGFVASENDRFLIYDGINIKWITKEEKIPYPKLKSVRYSNYGIFLLSDKGVMLYNENKEWDYFHSRYYIPDWDTNDIIVDSMGNIIVATKKGIGIISPKQMTLREKEGILSYAMKTRHNRMGFYSPCGLKNSGDLSSAFTHDDDNDGQWSGMYLAALCFKHVITKDENVLKDARETLDALLLLETVTGKKGFFARSVVEPELCDIKREGGGEWHLSNDNKWCFKGDTSSDEYVGHIFGLSIYYDYCANEEEKRRIREIHSELQRHIVLNGYKILDLDGEVTTHGHFDPEWIKTTGLFGDAGLNAAMILGGLRFAYHITGDSFFEEHFYKLARDERYFDYVRRIQDINTAVQINHDSEEMSFLALFTLIRLEKDPKFLKYWYEGLENIYQTQIIERNPEFNMIYAFFNPQKDYHLEDSIRTLREFYTHGIEWRVYNSHRSDYISNPVKDRFGRAQSIEVFPYNQKRVIRWAENPFVLDEEGEGYSEQILTPFLLPYWMGRFLGVIK